MLSKVDTGMGHRRSLVFTKRGLFTLVVVVAVSGLAWSARTGVVARDELHAASQKVLRVAELQGTIAYLDEWLTMSAQMAVCSGETRWSERFEEAAPKLEAAIVEVTNLATPEVKVTLARTTGEAHRDLVTMERRALLLVAEGNAPAAQKLLDGPEFAYLKEVYADGIIELGESLKSMASGRAADLDRQAWIEAISLCAGMILLVATVLMFRGHSRLKKALEQTETVARTDALTGLPNRRQFYDDLQVILADVADRDNSYALLLIDLDRFKAANDAYGHPAGDEVLQRVSARLRAIVRHEDVVTRLGGDEFAILMVLDSTVERRSSADPAQVAKRVVNALREPFPSKEGAAVQIGASIGIAIAQRGCGGASDLIHRADVALFRAKAEGRGCFRFFEQSMDDRVQSRARLEGELRQAIAEDAIIPHFQPLVDLATGRMIGVEMLARWPHPTRGLVPPAEFIPVAEDLGLIGSMTDRLLRQACRAAANWPVQITLACNLSPLQLLDPGLPGIVKAILDDTRFPAGRLELEITESALVGDVALARSLLVDLKVLGVRLALDDFGTGYSSLRHLQMLPFDKLKIDASFVGAMTSDKESDKIVSAVVGLGHSLGLLVVAEGIETAETAALLRNLGCDIGQGWLFGRPVAADGIDHLLRSATFADPANGDKLVSRARSAHFDGRILDHQQNVV